MEGSKHSAMEDAVRIAGLETRVAALEAAVGRLILQMASSPMALAYPEPLATPLAREKGAGLHHEKFFSLLDAGEACIQYSGAIAIALLVSAGQRFDISECFKQPVTLGRWAQIIRDIVKCEWLEDTAIGHAVKSSLVRPNGRPTPTGLYLFDEFINLRNEERGHASSLPDSSYERLHLRHENELHDALGCCTYLTYPLVKVESVDVATDPFTYDVRLLVGPPPLTSRERVQAATRVRPGATCVWDGSGTLLDLMDIVVYRSCPTCDLEHTFFLERWAGTSKHYHAYFGNHRFAETASTEG